MNVSRRLFLGGVLSLSAASTVKTTTAVPTLWGDLKHDDAPALNALFRGEPIRVMRGKALEGGRPALVGANCLLLSPVSIQAKNAYVGGCNFLAGRGFNGRTLVRVEADGAVFEGCSIDARCVVEPVRGLTHLVAA